MQIYRGKASQWNIVALHLYLVLLIQQNAEKISHDL